MKKPYFVRACFYIFGIILIALGIAMHQKHYFGNGPYTQFNVILTRIFSVRLGTMMMISGFSIVLVYFMIKKNKDIFVSIIAILLLGNIVNFFNDTLLYNFTINYNNIFLRVLTFIIAINVVSIGVVVMLKTKLSMLDLEMVAILLSDLKMLKRFNFGQIRMLIDGLLIILAIFLSLIFINRFDITEYSATIAVFLLGGLLINAYLKIYDILFIEKNKTNY